MPYHTETIDQSDCSKLSKKIYEFYSTSNFVSVFLIDDIFLKIIDIINYTRSLIIKVNMSTVYTDLVRKPMGEKCSLHHSLSECFHQMSELLAIQIPDRYPIWGSSHQHHLPKNKPYNI